MTIKQFIEKAIGGGWDNQYHIDYYLEDRDRQSTLFLKPEVWQAVGKVEGWDMNIKGLRPEWQIRMHKMIDFICEGKSLEDYIKTL